MEEHKLKNRELMRPVCEMIRKYAGFYNELLAAWECLFNCVTGLSPKNNGNILTTANQGNAEVRPDAS